MERTFLNTKFHCRHSVRSPKPPNFIMLGTIENNKILLLKGLGVVTVVTITQGQWGWEYQQCDHGQFICKWKLVRFSGYLRIQDGAEFDNWHRAVSPKNKMTLSPI